MDKKKVLDKVWNIWVPLRKLSASPGIPSWYESGSHCFDALPAKMSAFNRHTRLITYCRNLKWAFEHLRTHYCYAISINSRTTRWQVSQPASEGKWADMSVLQTQWCRRWGCRGCKFIPKSFDLSKIRAKSLKIWAQMLWSLCSVFVSNETLTD